MRAVRRVISIVPRDLHIQPGWSRTLVLLMAIATICLQLTAAINRLNDHSLGDSVGIIRLSPDLVVMGMTEEAERIGIRKDDRVRELNGQEVWSRIDYRHTLNELPIGISVPLVMDRAGTEVETGPVLVVRSLPQVPLFVMRHLVGLTCVIVAAWVGLARPSLRAAQLFFVAALGLGAYYSLLTSRDPVLLFVQAAVLVLTPALIVHFFLVFPKEWAIIDSKWRPLVYLPSLILLGLMAAAYWQLAQGGPDVGAAQQNWLHCNTVGFVLLAASGAFGLFALGRAYVRAENARPEYPSGVRRQLQWILWGLGLASLAAVVDLVFSLLNLHTSESSIVLLLGVWPLPLAFAFSILRYRLWDIDLVLGRSAVYSLLTAVLAAVYVLLIGVLSTALGLIVDAAASAAVLFVSALVIGILVNPLRERIHRLIDRTFFRSVVDYQQLLAAWSETLSTSLRFADLAALLLEEVPRALQLERAWLLVLNEQETALEPIVAADAPDSLVKKPISKAADALASAVDTHLSPVRSVSAQGMLAAQFEGSANVLLLDDIQDSVAVYRDALSQWHTSGVRVALPLLSGGRLVGVYLLGNKLSGDVYQRSDLDLLRTLANQAAVAISNARLYEQVRAFSQVLETRVRERTKELREFVSVVYHELSTPITAIRGYSEVLLDGVPGPLTERQARYLESVKRSTERLIRLVADLSDVNKIDAGRMTIYPEPMDLEEAVTEALASLSDLIEEKGLQVSTHLAKNATHVMGDPQRVVQILTNLVSNACRYTPEGGRVEVCAERAMARNQVFEENPVSPASTEVTVRDTGIGIAKEDLDAIFERFYRSPDPLVQAQAGTGLGLAITRSLVELHGGKLWVNSMLGQGSTFGFALQATEAVHE